MAQSSSHSLSSLDTARRVYREMMVKSGLSAADFRVACEDHQTFWILKGTAPYWQYQNAAVDVVADLSGVTHTTNGRAVCDRCGGKGYINAFRHISGGVCFECDGTGQPTSFNL